MVTWAVLGVVGYVLYNAFRGATQLPVGELGGGVTVGGAPLAVSLIARGICCFEEDNRRRALYTPCAGVVSPGVEFQVLVPAQITHKICAAAQQSTQKYSSP